MIDRGIEALHCNTISEMVQKLVDKLGNHDIVVTFSNGPFDNIHENLASSLDK